MNSCGSNRSLRRLIMLGVLLMPGMMGISPVLATGSDELENLLSGLPILPEKANERIETSSSNIAQWKLRIFFSTMSKPEMLGINLLPIGLSPDVLDRPVAVEINNSTKGELLALILQINRLAAVQFNESTVLIIPVADRKNFQLGKKSRKIYQLVYAPTSRVLAFIDTAPALQNLINRQNIFEHVEGNSILVIDTPENIAIMDSVVNMIDAKPNKIQARIPISFLDESSFKSAIAALGTDVTDRIDVNSIYYSTEGRSLIVYDSPENVEFLRNVVRKIDLAPRQVLIDTAIMTVESTFTRELGIRLSSSGFQVDSLDRLLNQQRLRRFLQDNNVLTSAAQINYILAKNGAQTLANPKIRTIDGERAQITIGDIIVVQIVSQTSQQPIGGGQQVSQNVTPQEVTTGVQLSVEPTIHHDRTVTLDLQISNDQPTQIQAFGVNRKTTNSTTKLRVKDGETIILGGFINKNDSYDKQPVPILGEIPFLRSIFNANRRARTNSELVFLLTPYILEYVINEATGEAELPRDPGSRVPEENEVNLRIAALDKESVKTMRSDSTHQLRDPRTGEPVVKHLYAGRAGPGGTNGQDSERAIPADVVIPPQQLADNVASREHPLLTFRTDGQLDTRLAAPPLPPGTPIPAPGLDTPRVPFSGDSRITWGPGLVKGDPGRDISLVKPGLTPPATSDQQKNEILRDLETVVTDVKEWKAGVVKSRHSQDPKDIETYGIIGDLARTVTDARTLKDRVSQFREPIEIPVVEETRPRVDDPSSRQGPMTGPTAVPQTSTRALTAASPAADSRGKSPDQAYPSREASSDRRRGPLRPVPRDLPGVSHSEALRSDLTPNSGTSMAPRTQPSGTGGGSPFDRLKRMEAEFRPGTNLNLGSAVRSDRPGSPGSRSLSPAPFTPPVRETPSVRNSPEPSRSGPPDSSTTVGSPIRRTDPGDDNKMIVSAVPVRRVAPRLSPPPTDPTFRTPMVASFSGTTGSVPVPDQSPPEVTSKDSSLSEQIQSIRKLTRDPGTVISGDDRISGQRVPPPDRTIRASPLAAEVVTTGPWPPPKDVSDGSRFPSRSDPELRSPSSESDARTVLPRPTPELAPRQIFDDRLELTLARSLPMTSSPEPTPTARPPVATLEEPQQAATMANAAPSAGRTRSAWSSLRGLVGIVDRTKSPGPSGSNPYSDPASGAFTRDRTSRAPGDRAPGASSDRAPQSLVSKIMVSDRGELQSKDQRPIHRSPLSSQPVSDGQGEPSPEPSAMTSIQDRSRILRERDQLASTPDVGRGEAAARNTLPRTGETLDALRRLQASMGSRPSETAPPSMLRSSPGMRPPPEPGVQLTLGTPPPIRPHSQSLAAGSGRPREPSNAPPRLRSRPPGVTEQALARLANDRGTPTESRDRRLSLRQRLGELRELQPRDQGRSEPGTQTARGPSRENSGSGERVRDRRRPVLREQTGDRPSPVLREQAMDRPRPVRNEQASGQSNAMADSGPRPESPATPNAGWGGLRGVLARSRRLVRESAGTSADQQPSPTPDRRPRQGLAGSLENSRLDSGTGQPDFGSADRVTAAPNSGSTVRSQAVPAAPAAPAERRPSISAPPPPVERARAVPEPSWDSLMEELESELGGT